ncbi:MAG: TonB-dependent receptor [Bacteroidales bacterium]|nr:TonB-dependent receptor [Bacteroidales bacterium]
MCAMVCPAKAQTVIQGTVLDEQSKAVDAFVSVSPKGSGSMIAYADADEKGNYKLEFKTDADSVTVSVSGFGIGNQAKVVANRSQQLNFTVKEEMTELKEVSVKAEKIRQNGDTISYLVGAYQEQGDRVIGDVLKRMPGIEVSESGSIKYNGKAIKKFYVEEMDLLQGRYGLATNNINASDVASVQVMEHHQSVKMLEGKELTDDVAINLKLKDAAKGTVAVNTMVGMGGQTPQPPLGGASYVQDVESGVSNQLASPFLLPLKGDGGSEVGRNPLWTAEVVGMYFAKTRQNMTLYKGNNTGDDVSKELTEHYSGINSVMLYPFCPTGAVLPSGSGLPQKRTFDNHSHILTMNHLEKLKGDREVGLNIAYYNDRIRREGSSFSDRFLSEDNRLLTQETMMSETKMNNLNIQARYNLNSLTGFVANVLKFDTNWNSDCVDGLLSSNQTGAHPISYGDERVRQHFDRPELSVSETFNTIRNIGKNNFDLHFSAGYAQRPNTLTAEIDSLQQDTHTAYTQDVTSHHIAGQFNTGYNIGVGDYFKFNYGISASANLHGIVTDLKTLPLGGSREALNVLPEYVSVGEGSNDLWYNTYSVALDQSYKYERHNYSFTLGLPLNLYSQMLDDRIRQDRHSYTHLLFFPSLSFWWDITRDLWLNGGASYSKTVGDPGGIYSGYIMSNYRTFQRSYVEQLSETKNYGANVNLRYRNALQALFANIGFNFRRSHDNQIYGYTYEGATSVIQAVNQPTVADNYSVNGEASKGFDFLRSSVRVFASYALTQSERLIADKLYQFNAQSLNFGGSLSFSPADWMGVVYSCGFANSRSYTEGHQDAAQCVRSNTQRLSMSIYPTKTLTLTLAAEDNYNNLTATNRHAWFGDATAKLKLKRVDLELQANNLFDQRRYTRINYSGLDIYSQTSQLRPRNIIATIRFKVL